MTGPMKTKTIVILKYPNNFLFKLKGYKCNAGYLPKLPYVTNYTKFKEMLWYTYRRELTENDIQILALEIHDYIMDGKNILEFKSKENILKEKLDTFEENDIYAYYCDLREKDMKEVYNLLQYAKSHASNEEQIVDMQPEKTEAVDEGKIKMGRRLKTKEKEEKEVPVMPLPEPAETKAEKFVRLTSRDTEVLLDRLRQLRNKANTSVYDYTEEDVKAIFDELQAELDYTKRYFEDKLKNKRRRRS